MRLNLNPHILLVVQDPLYQLLSAYIGDLGTWYWKVKKLIKHKVPLKVWPNPISLNLNCFNMIINFLYARSEVLFECYFFGPAVIQSHCLVISAPVQDLRSVLGHCGHRSIFTSTLFQYRFIVMKLHIAISERLSLILLWSTWLFLTNFFTFIKYLHHIIVRTHVILTFSMPLLFNAIVRNITLSPNIIWRCLRLVGLSMLSHTLTTAM